MKKILIILLMLFLVGCDAKEKEEKEEPIIEKKDEIAPLIQYGGDLDLNPKILLGNNIDLLNGIMAIDNIDGDISNKVIVDKGDLDMKKIGTYTVTYSVTDSSGNLSAPFTRTITIYEDNSSKIISSGTITDFNITRKEGFMVYYDYQTMGTTTKANSYGYEISVSKEGFVIQVGTNIVMTEGGFSLSAHGANRMKLTNVQVGDIVTVDKENKKFEIKRDELLSSVFQSGLRLEQINIIKNEAYNAGYDFDLEEVESLIKQGNDKYQQLLNSNISSNEKQTLVDEINTLADNVIFMTSYLKSSEIRAIWHRPNALSSEYNLEGVKKTVTKFKTLGFNVVFLESFWSGYSSYESNILERHPAIKNNKFDEYGDDYFLAFVTEANKIGLDVHAWAHTFGGGNATLKSKVIKDEWLLEDYQGRKLHPNEYGGTYYLDPSNPEVVDFISQVFVEIVTKYEVKGLQYDYVRYCDNNYTSNPVRDSGYGEFSENKFKQDCNIEGDVKTLVLKQENRTVWAKWRQQNVSNAVKAFTESIRKANKDIIISAAVSPDIEYAKITYMQDWLTWVQNGYIDVLCPMIYTGSFGSVATKTTNTLKLLGNKTYLVPGIAPLYYNYPLIENHRQILATTEASGNAIFASQNILYQYVNEDSLKIGVYRNADTCTNLLDDPKVYVTHSVNTILKNVDNIYLKRNLIENNIDITNFKNKLNAILNMNCNNPADYEVIITCLKDALTLSNGLNNDGVKEIITKDINVLTTALDIRISRDLIKYGYWDGITTRVDPKSFTYGE